MSERSPESSPAPPLPRRENLWIALACNAAYPAAVLTWLSDRDRLGPTAALLLAVVVPIAYGVRDYWLNRRWNIFALLGLVSTLLTGGFGLLQLSGFWFAVKEAAVPLVLGLAVPLSMNTRQPLIRLILFNDQVLDTRRIQAALVERKTTGAFEALLRGSSWLVAASFFLSAVLNFTLALFILRSTPGTPEFNRELGRLTALSYPVIMLPSMAILMFAIWKLINGLEKLTGMDADDLFHRRSAPSAPSTGTGPATDE